MKNNRFFDSRILILLRQFDKKECKDLSLLRDSVWAERVPRTFSRRSIRTNWRLLSRNLIREIRQYKTKPYTRGNIGGDGKS